MEFEQRIQIAQQQRPWARTCWSIYDGLTREGLQIEYRKLAEELVRRQVDSLDIGCTKILLEMWGEKPTEELALDYVLMRKESQLNCIGLRLERDYLLVTDTLNWFR